MVASRQRWSEYVDYIGPDGTVYPLYVPSRVGRWVMSQSGWGTPPIDYITERGPFQHGESVKDYFLRPRTIQLLIRQQFCGREEYWSGRASLLNAIRPNRQLTPTGTLPGSLRLTLSNGTKRAIDCYIAEGPRFEPRNLSGWDEYAFQEVLRFTAYNPVIYDPGGETVVFGSQDELVFPITFPIVFGSFGGTANVNYVGTWLEYPTLIITGPASDPIVTNVTTGETIALDYDIPAGVAVTITLKYGEKTVTDSLGNNLIGVVTPGSALATFHLAPDPEAPGGINEVMVSASGTNADSSLVISYFTRYFGI
jgi:hypothetical protein